MEYTDTELNDIPQVELLKMLSKSRLETKSLYSEEVKELYYKSRYAKIIEAKHNKVKALINANNIIAEDVKTSFNTKLDTVLADFTNLNAKYEEMFVDSNSTYQMALKTYHTKKGDLLEAKLHGHSSTDIAIIDANLDYLKSALDAAKVTAEGAVTLAEGALSVSLSALESILTSVSTLLDLDAVDAAIDTAKDAYKDSFYTQYESTYTSNTYWQNYWTTINPLD